MKHNHKKLPKFDPEHSGKFAAEILEKLKLKGALIGRLAVWAWLPVNSEKQAFTKDLDIAVSKSGLFEIRKYFFGRQYEIRELQIGGLNVRYGANVNVDFIDRSAIEWSDYSRLFESAIDEAVKSNRTLDVGNKSLLLVSADHLVVLKLATGESKDEDDAKVLLSQVDVDITAIRTLISKHLGPSGRNRFEIILKDIGHKESKIIKIKGSSLRLTFLD